MKKSIWLLVTYGALCLGSTIALAQSERLRNVEAVTAVGEYSNPVWSPDGQQLLFTEAHQNQLFVMNLEGDRRVEKIKEGRGIGYLASWSEDGRGIVYREPTGQHGYSDLQVKRIDLASKREQVLPNVHPDYLKHVDRKNQRAAPPLIVYINLETLKLEAKRGQDGTPWVVTPEDGQFYQPILSPDERSVVVHEGPRMYLYSIEGNGPRKDLGIGLATSWQPDGRGVLTFEDQSADGHTITASDLFLVAWDKQAMDKIQLTRTGDRLEMWGDISPDGKRIAFSDEKSGRIFVADLNL